jgi:copper resistance protein B
MSASSAFRIAVTVAAVLALSPASSSGQEGPASASPPQVESPPAILPITDADRAAAFPDIEGHSVHDRAMTYFVLLDQLEWRDNDEGGGMDWDDRGWIGGDLNRFWFRTEGAVDSDRVHEAQAHLLYGRAVARWWDLVVGVRHDFGQGPDRSWAAFGVQGLAPYWFEIEATAYVGGSGRTQGRLEVEYELLLTNRLVLQPVVEVEFHGKSDAERGVGAGLSSADAGLRLRYELRRELAPYVGLVWTRKFFGTADLADAAGDSSRAAQLVAGLRAWF